MTKLAIPASLVTLLVIIDSLYSYSTFTQTPDTGSPDRLSVTSTSIKISIFDLILYLITSNEKPEESTVF